MKDSRFITNTILIILVCLSIISLCYLHIIKKRIKLIISSSSTYYKNNNQDNLDDTCNTCNKSINRQDFYKMFPKIDKINSLEIAPYFTPVLIGEKVKYFDVLGKSGLIEKAESENLDTSKIPDIHYVHPFGDMNIINEKFQLIFSSHNIEHQVDLVKHLQQIGNLLEKNGKFFIAIPDKRYCFDHFIAKSMLSDVLAAYWQKISIHSLKTILAMRCETGHNDPPRYWSGSAGALNYQTDESCYFKALKEFKDAKGSYIDSHKWRFTPKSFMTIINELNKMKLQPLIVEKVFDTESNSNEFYAILHKP